MSLRVDPFFNDNFESLFIELLKVFYKNIHISLIAFQ